ncbi:DHCW motif cupin fold protein [Aurantibacillus circumpalustris]|uniref:DHCW motif cupin fold protein n=1 Tax=Aurantibacillus circumpalustris TaxID=3036359 RepID=UPI00295BBA3D|nr:DHCW motif cupin fold protein [Aurantibacillus circumpalustris]
MILNNIPPNLIDWHNTPTEKSNGAKGFASSKIKLFGDIKIRQVQYSADYLADHWCVKGHIIHILEGELILDYKDGTSHIITANTTYIVGDDGIPHMAKSINGALVLVID